MGEHAISLTASAVQAVAGWSDRQRPPEQGAFDGLRRLLGHLGKPVSRRTPARTAPRFGLLLLMVVVASAGCARSSGGGVNAGGYATTIQGHLHH